MKLTGKPGSVVDSHSSRPAIAHWLKQPTRVQYGPYHVNPYLALLRVEFTVPRTVASRAVRSYRTLSPLPDPLRAIGGLLSVALVVGLRPPGVTWHPALWSPDFPPLRPSPFRDDDEAATVWSASAADDRGNYRHCHVFLSFNWPAAELIHAYTTHFFSRHGFQPPRLQLF